MFTDRKTAIVKARGMGLVSTSFLSFGGG